MAPGSESTDSGSNRPPTFGTPPPPKKWYPGTGGGGGGKIEKFIGGEFLPPRMMLLLGVRHPMAYIGVRYANDPKKRGGIWHLRLRLI